MSEFGQPKPKEKIVIANEYGSVHTKAWIVPKKKRELERDRVVKGPCRMRGPNGSRTFDSTEEMLKAMWQDTDAKLAPYRYPDQESFKNVEKQTGNGMWHTELVKRICKLNRYLFVEDSLLVPGSASFYTTRNNVKTYTGANFRKGFVPEFTIMKCDAADLPVDFTWGWRTVLMRLVKFGCLNMNQINRVWGDVHLSDSRGKHWAAHMEEFRV